MFNAPNEFVCPITRCVMLDPVILGDGHSYDREAITEWFEQETNQGKRRFRSPVTNLEIGKEMFDNVLLRSQVVEWLEKTELKVEGEEEEEEEVVEGDEEQGGVEEVLMPRRGSTLVETKETKATLIERRNST